VAVSLTLLDLPFKHESVSVFRHFEQFSAINPLVKAPTLVADDGTVLMDSSLILEHVERLAPGRLMPADVREHTLALRWIGLALAAAEKSVSIYYERNLRPAEKLHQPWMDRVTGQLLLAYQALEAEMPDDWFAGAAFGQAEITTAVAWRFTQQVIADVVPAADFPRLAAMSARAETTVPFRATDYD
jgi:glutathione S-transferase